MTLSPNRIPRSIVPKQFKPELFDVFNHVVGTEKSIKFVGLRNQTEPATTDMKIGDVMTIGFQQFQRIHVSMFSKVHVFQCDYGPWPTRNKKNILRGLAVRIRRFYERVMQGKLTCQLLTAGVV